MYGNLFLPHDAQAHGIDTGKTRIQAFKEIWPNIDISTVPKLSPDDGISRRRLMFSHLWIDEKNYETFVDSIAQYG